jgi:hypothetical protein
LLEGDVCQHPKPEFVDRESKNLVGNQRPVDVQGHPLLPAAPVGEHGQPHVAEDVPEVVLILGIGSLSPEFRISGLLNQQPEQVGGPIVTEP